MQHITLNNDVRMPVAGLGTFLMSPAEAEEATLAALRAGYRHIDTANGYYNEAGVARGIRRSGLPREDLFVSTKLWPSGYGRAAKHINATLARMGLSYIDMLILHQPCGEYLAAWRAMEDAYKAGKVRALGLSNFPTEKIQEVIDAAEIRPQLVTVENHPYHPQDDLRAYLAQYGIVIEAWFPLGHGDAALREEPVFAELAEKYGKSPVQVILRWHIQKGNSIIPGSKSWDHLKENLDVYDFALADDEMAEIAELATPGKAYYAADESAYERYLAIPDEFDAQEAAHREALKSEVLEVSTRYWDIQLSHDVDGLREVADPRAPFVHMGITMDREGEIDAIENELILTKRADTKELNVFFYEDDTVAIVLRQLELTALVGGSTAINPFMATETYTKQTDNSWKLISFVFTHINPEGYQYRFLAAK
ncbi:MAG: aldo/keto reductase [Acidobacteriota bacterium]|nr:aldo/keto reductase [Acidobacteriota bacterium]